MDAWGAHDLERRLANLIRVATITELDDESATCRVSCAAVPDSAWLPILTLRAGPDRSYWLPEPGEQIILLSPSGDPAQGVVLPAGFQAAHPPPAGRRTIHLHEYADGTVTEYDRENHVLTVDCVGDVVLRAAGSLTAEIAQNVTATVGGRADATVQGPVSLTSPSTVSITAPLTKINGPLTVSGLFTYQGGLVGSGGSGPAAQIAGTLEATTDVTGGGVSLRGHRHTGDDGGSTSPPR